MKHDLDKDGRVKNYMLVSCSYSHFKYRSMKSKTHAEEKFTIMQKDGSFLEIQNKALRNREFYFMERRGKNIHLCSNISEIEVEPNNTTIETNPRKNIIFSKRSSTFFVQVDVRGTISLSTGKTLGEVSRVTYRADYKLDSRDLVVDDTMLYFVDVHNFLNLVNVTDWNNNQPMTTYWAKNALIYDSQVATFTLANNLLYVAFDNCSVVLFTKKKIHRHGIDLQSYWTQEKVLTLNKLSEKGLIISKEDVPTAIKVGSSYIIVAIFEEETRHTKIIFSYKDLSKVKVKTVRPCKGNLSPIFHMVIVKTHLKDYLIAAFRMGGLALFNIKTNSISAPIHSYGMCYHPINGLNYLPGTGILVVYGDRLLTSILLKQK